MTTILSERIRVLAARLRVAALARVLVVVTALRCPRFEAEFRTCERYRRRSGIRKLVRHPVRETWRAAYATLPWLPTRPSVAKLFTGERLAVVLPELAGLDLYRHGCIEPDLTAVVLRRVEPGMTFIDVGAHYGYYTSLARSLVGEEGLVVAFEPGRESFAWLSRNLGWRRNVRLENAAVGARTGLSVLRDFGSRKSALNTLQREARAPLPERENLRPRECVVRCVRLDDYVAEAKIRPDFVKIDAEGSELDVLLGMEQTLREGRCVVSLEVGDYPGSSAALSSECISLMGQFGYSCFEGRGGMLVPHQPRHRYNYGNLCFLNEHRT